MSIFEKYENFQTFSNTDEIVVSILSKLTSSAAALAWFEISNARDA